MSLIDDDWLAWMKTRLIKAETPGAGESWGPEWVRAYREDVAVLIAEVERLRESQS